MPKVSRDGDKFTVELESKWVKFDDFIMKTNSEAVTERSRTEPHRYSYRERAPIDPDLDVDNMKFAIVEVRRGKEKGQLKFKPYSFHEVGSRRTGADGTEPDVVGRAEKDWNWKHRVLNDSIQFSLDDKNDENE